MAEGKTKAETAIAIYRHLHESPQQVVLQAFVEGASLTSKGAPTYWCGQFQIRHQTAIPSTRKADRRAVELRYRKNQNRGHERFVLLLDTGARYCGIANIQRSKINPSHIAST